MTVNLSNLQQVPVLKPNHMLPLYARRNVCFERGSGMYLYDGDNKEYLDFGAGVGVNIFGYDYAPLKEVIIGGLQVPWHVSNGYRITAAERLSEKIAIGYGFDDVFFCNSGSEATDALIKSVLAYSQLSKPEIIVFSGAFHGRTIAATSASCNRHGFYDVFGTPMHNFVHVERNMAAVRSAFNRNTAAVFLEPIQGHNGCSGFTDEMLRELRALCDERGTLLCYDCIQAGCGRTGDFFAFQRSGAKPDILTLAKGIGGGLPMGVCVFNKRAAVLKVGQHGSTCGGNVLCCGVASFVWDEIHTMLPHVKSISDKLEHVLDQLHHRYPRIIKGHLGRGLVRAILLQDDIAAAEASRILLYRGLITILSDCNSLRLLPPYIMDDSHITRFTEIMTDFLNDVEKVI